MLLRHLDLLADYDRIARLLNVTLIGVPFPNIDRLAAFGVRVQRGHGTLQMIRRHLKENRPCIVPVRTGQLSYWQGEDIAHAIVTIGIDADYVYVHDPAFPHHPIHVTHGDFDLAWLERDEEYACLIH